MTPETGPTADDPVIDAVTGQPTGATGGPDATDGPDATGGSDAVTAAGPPRPSWRAVGGWILLVGVAVALDGLVGGLTLVVIAAVLLAGLAPRVIGALGVLLLVLAPIAVVVEGVPSASEISPAFVSRSLLPHHLTFAGLVLVSAFALLDLVPHLRDWAGGERPPQDDGPPLGAVLGTVVVVVVALGALAACWAVLGA